MLQVMPLQRVESSLQWLKILHAARIARASEHHSTISMGQEQMLATSIPAVMTCLWTVEPRLQIHAINRARIATNQLVNLVPLDCQPVALGNNATSVR